jgi:hypothetical protein
VVVGQVCSSDALVLLEQVARGLRVVGADVGDGRTVARCYPLGRSSPAGSPDNVIDTGRASDTGRVSDMSRPREFDEVAGPEPSLIRTSPGQWPKASLTFSPASFRSDLA